MKFDWRGGNRIQLLENGEAFFPRLHQAIGEAQREVLVETFILAEDKVGLALQEQLIAAATRGVQVVVSVDGFGSADLSSAYVKAMTDVGIKIQMFEPGRRLFGQRLNVFRRLHRKLVVVDGERAFVGGINYSAEHLADFGPRAKQDYAVEVIGPVVDDIHRFLSAAINGSAPLPRQHWWQRRTPAPLPSSNRPHSGEAQVLFVTRDNHRHRDDIEDQYLQAIRSAQSRLVIANAYFFPGYRLLREIRSAAQRGVEVRLILQGQPDMPIAKFAARMLYNYLLRDGVQIYEYCTRPLHGKVALADDEWSTVGSSNLDPLSLSLNLEANLIIRDATFNQELHQRLSRLMEQHCKRISLERILRGKFWRAPLIFVYFHFLRHFPALVSLFPAHRPRLAQLKVDQPNTLLKVYENKPAVPDDEPDEPHTNHTA
jgi:cardiolipin synthase